MCARKMPSGSRSPLAAAAHSSGFGAAVAAADPDSAAEPRKPPQRVPLVTPIAKEATIAAPAAAAAATANYHLSLLERKLQLCSAADICLIKGTTLALVSVSLEPQVVQQLCRSLPHDLLKDFPPSLLLLLHEQQQQQRQQGEAEQTSLLLGLAAALEQRCSASKGLPSFAPHAAVATGKAATTGAATTVPEFAVAVLEAQTKILHKLREALLEPLTDSLDLPYYADAATGQLARHAVELLRRSCSSNSKQLQQQVHPLQQQLRNAYRRCRCLIPASSPSTFLSPILAVALQQRVLLLHPQVMPLLSGLISAAADVAALLHCSNSSASSTTGSPGAWCPLSDEQLLHAGHELLATATHLFPSEYFQQHQQQQVLLQEDTLRTLLLEAPKDGAFPPINTINPQLTSRPLTDRQDAWIDLLQQLLLLLPPGRPRLDWVVAAGLDVLLLRLLLRSSLPLVRPLLLPLLLDSCGVDLQLEQQHQQQRLQQQRQLHQKFFASAAARALRDGLHMAAYVTFVEGLAAAPPPFSAALVARPYTNVQQQSTAPSLQTSSNSDNKECSSRSRSRMCVFKQMADALGGRSRHSSSPGTVVADVLQVLLLERFQGDATAPGSNSSSSSSCCRRIRAALLNLIDHTTAEAAAAAAAEAARDLPCGCEKSAHLFGALLLLSCPQQWTCDRLCFLACNHITTGPSLLVQPDCLLEAVSLIGEAPRRFICSAATHLLLLLQQQQQQEQQQQLLRACACLIDMYDPCLLEECNRTLQQEERSSCLLQQQGHLYRLLLLQRLFSVSLQQRQSAAAALKALLQLPASLGTDPVGVALRLWSEQRQRQQQQEQQQVCGLLLEEAEVQLLCAAAVNRRLCAATRAESLNTLHVYLHASPADARPFLRSLCCSLLAVLPGYVLKGGIAASAAAAAASAAAAAAEVSGAACDDDKEPLLLSLLELLRFAVHPQQQLQELLQLPLLHQQQEQHALLTAAARALSLPLLLLPPKDPLLHPVLEVYRHLLGDALLLLCFSKQEALSLACLQLCAVLLFHPQQSLLLPHRICPMAPQVEALLRAQQPQQQTQQQHKPRLVLPTWLSLRVELPVETETFSCCTAAQAAWASRSEDLAFFVASQLASDPRALKAAAAAAAATAAFTAGGATAPVLQQDEPGVEDSSTRSSSPSSPLASTGAAAATVASATTAPVTAAVECSVCLCRSQSVYMGSALSEPSPEGTNNKTEFALIHLSLSRQTAQQLLLPVHPTLKKLLGVLSHPPLLQGALPPLRMQQQQQQQWLGDSYCTLPVALSASSPPSAPAGGNPPSDATTYAEALQYCKRITAALKLPGDSAATAICCLRRGGLAAAAATTRCCCCALSVGAAKGLRAVAVAVKRYTYPYLQQLAQQVAETMLGAEEQTAAAAAVGLEELMQQQPASGGAAAVCSSEIDLLLLGTQLLTELLPLAAVAAAPAGTPCSCSSSTNLSIISSECDCCSRWMILPNLSQFCGSLLGVSSQLPLLRRAALQLAAVALPHSLPPRPCSTSSSIRICLPRAQASELLALDSTVFAAGLGNSSGSSSSGRSNILLQLQLQQLLHLHSRLAAEDEASMQEQQPLADALEALTVCVAHNSFAVVAAAAAEAAAEWQELAASSPAGPAQDHYQLHQLHYQQQQQQTLLEAQVKLLFSLMGKANPAVRVAAWRCLRCCLQMASGLLEQLLQQQQQHQLQQHQLHQQQQQDLLLRIYSWTCSEICQRLLVREGLLPGGFCCCCPSSCREVAEALQCLSTLRWSSRPSSSSSSPSNCSIGISAAGIKAGYATPAAAAAAAAALDEWVASESFVHRTFAALLSFCSSSSITTSHLGAASHKTALNGLTAALELLCCSAQTHSGSLLQLLQQPQQRQQQIDQTGASAVACNQKISSDSRSSSSILSSIVEAVCPRPHPLLLPFHSAAGGPAFSAAAAAAVAAAGTQDAAGAFAAAAKAAPAEGASVCVQEITKCCRALQLLLTLLDGADTPGPFLGSNNCAVAAAPTAAARADAESIVLLRHVEALVQAAAVLLLRPPPCISCSRPCCCGEERDNRRSRHTAAVPAAGATAAGVAAAGFYPRAIGDIVHELLLLLLRLFVILHEQTALQVAKQLPGETSVLLLLLQQREELQRQRQQQQQLDDDLLQTLQGIQLGTAAAASSDAATAQKAAADYLWASPSLWLFIVLCLQPVGVGAANSFGVPREAAALTVCLLRLSYDSSSKYFKQSKAKLEAEGLPEVPLPFSGGSPFQLPPLLPPLPPGHLQLYGAKDTQQKLQQPILLPTDPRMAVGLFSAAALLLLQQLRCRSLAALCPVTAHQRTPPSLRRHSAAATAAAAAAAASASPAGSRGRGRSKVCGLLSPPPQFRRQPQQQRPSSSCCSSPMNASHLSVHSISAAALADTNHFWQEHQQHADSAFGDEQHQQRQQQQQSLLLQQNRQEYRNSCLLHALGEVLLLLFAGHPTAATAAAWTRFISPPDNSSRKPVEPLLLPAHLAVALECLLHGAAAASLLNFAAALGARRPQQKPPSLRQQQQQQQRDDGVGDLGSLLSVNNSGRSCGNLLLHRVLLLLQLLSAACTCTPDGFAAAAAAAPPLPFGAVVAAVSALWRLCSLQQALLSLLLQFLQRCISARQQISLLGAPSSRRSVGASGLLLLETGEELLNLRLQEAGVVAALVDSVCNSLGSSNTSSSRRQQKLPPRLLCSVLLLLQHTLGPGVEGPLLMQLIGALAASLRPRLQQLLQRNTNRAAEAAAASSARLQWSLSPAEMLLLSSQLGCLGAATTSAAAAAAERQCLAPLFANGPPGSSPGKPRAFGGSDKESLEDFVAPLLLRQLPLQLVAALLHFLVSLTGATAPAAAATGDRLDMRIAQPQAANEVSSVCGSPRKSKGPPVRRAAARAVLLLQHTAAFHDALVFLFMVRLSPEVVFQLPLHNSGRDAKQQHQQQQQQQQQQQHWGVALRDALLLLLHVFLSDFRPASKLKQHAGPLLASLQDWMGVLQRKLKLHQQLQLQLLHEIRHLLLSSIRALGTLRGPGGP